MSESTYDELERLAESQGPAAALERLVESLEQQRNYHRLFDALCLKKRFEMGLPLARPASLDDVPPEKQEEFREHYIASARRVGELFLAADEIPQAWIYLRTINEPGPVREVLEKLSPRREADETTESLINVALWEGAHPPRGLEMMLHTHGTCNTITAMDQAAGQMTPEDRRRAAALLVDELYDELCGNVRYEVQQKLAGTPPAASLRELIAGRDWLFEEGNYHVDVSHLNSVVRFARLLGSDDPQLDKAIQLAEYGSRLDPQLQYPGDPPFDDFYAAHVQYFKALTDDGRDAAIEYFREKLDQEPDEEDKPMLAYVLVDLLIRCGRQRDAVDLAEKHLREIDDPAGFSFPALCLEAGRLDALRRAAREKNDPVAYAAALLVARSQAQSGNE